MNTARISAWTCPHACQHGNNLYLRVYRSYTGIYIEVIRVYQGLGYSSQPVLAKHAADSEEDDTTTEEKAAVQSRPGSASAADPAHVVAANVFVQVGTHELLSYLLSHLLSHL